MPNRFARTLRITAALGVAAMLPAGLAAAANDGTSFQLAQSSPRSAAPARPAAPAGQPQTGAAQVQQRMAELKQRLQITPAQQPQFDAFAQAMEQNAQTMDQLAQQEGSKAPANALDQLRLSAKVAETEADGLKRLVPAFEALYSGLSDQQKRTADQLFAGGQGQGQPAPAPRRHK